MQKNSLKRGVIFTISIFILSAVLLDLTSYLAQHESRSQDYFLPPTDGQILNSKISELSHNTQRTLGISADLQREKNNLTIRITGPQTPFPPQALGRADLGEYKSFYQTQWAQQNNVSCQLDTDMVNATGTFLQTNDKINYSQINSLSSANYAQFSIPYGYNFSNIQLDIYCTAPRNASYMSFDDWTSSGTTKRAIINYSDNLGNTHTNSVLFSQSVDETYSASYFDVEDSFLQKFDFNLINTNLLNISSQTNNTYWWFTLTKQNISCEWNLSVSLNYTNSTPSYLYMPITASLQYQNASYSGYLPIVRK